MWKVGPRHPSSVVRYAFAVGVLAAGLACKLLLPSLGRDTPFLLLFAGVIVAAWCGGTGPAALVIALGAFASAYFFLPPYETFALTATGFLRLSAFAVEATMVAMLALHARGARVKAELSAESQRRVEDQLRRENRARRALSRSNEILVRARDEATLLSEICAAIVEMGGYRLCWVGRAEDDDAKSVRPIAQHGDDAEYVRSAGFTWADVERGRGPTGTAIRTGRPSVQQDIEKSPTFAPWRAAAAERCYRASIALPLIIDRRVFGALSIYASEPDAFDEDELCLLTELADDLAFGIGALRARVAAEAERARFESVILKMPLAVAVFSGPEHVIRLANARWLELLPRTSPFLGKPIKEVVNPAVLPRVLATLDEARRTGEVREMTEVAVERPGGLTAFYDAAFQPVRDGCSLHGEIIAVVVDVTQRVAARRSLEQSSRAKDDFLRIASHELRTPLTPLLGWAQVLEKSGGRDLQQLRRGLEAILQSARSEARLVADLMDVSRYLAGEMKVETSLVDLGDVVRSCVAEARPLADRMGIRLDGAIDPTSAVLGEEARLRQVTQSLLSNALKFTPRGGHVCVDLTATPASVTLAVKDTGRGLTTEELACVFEPFQTGDASTTRKEPGLGLGLTVVRAIVETHGGKVKAESAGPGQGSAFLVELPPAPAERLAATSGLERASSPGA
jgi:signal transduction histidine kinase